MKKTLVVSFAFVLAVGLSSCYRQSVCATYVKNDAKKVKVEKNAEKELEVSKESM